MSRPVDTRHPDASTLPMLGRAVLWTGGGEILSKAAVLATTLLVARSLGPEDFVGFVGLSAVAVVAAGMWDFGFSTLLTREVAAGRASSRGAIGSAARARLRTFPLWVITFLVGSAVLGSLGVVSIPALIGFAAGSCLISASMVPVALLRAGLGFGSASVAQTAGRLLTAGLVFGAFSWLGSNHGLAVVSAALTMGEALTLLLALAFLWRSQRDFRGRRTDEAPLVLRAALPFAANGLLSMAYNRLDIVVVAALTSAAQVSAYAPASRIQDVSYLIPSMVGAVAFPVMARAWAGEDGPAEVRKLLLRFIAAGLMATVPIAVMAAILAPEAIRLSLGLDYSSAATPARVLVWSMPIAAIGAPLLAFLGATGRAGDTTRAFAAALLVSIALHLSLDPSFGANGAAVASTARDAANVAVAGGLVVRASRGGRPAGANAAKRTRLGVRTSAGGS